MKIKEEKRAPKQTSKHYTATVFIISKEQPRKILLAYYKKINKWMPPGDYQEFHENPIETTIREMLEETGLDISNYFKLPTKIDDRAVSFSLPRFILEEKIEAYKNQPPHFHLDMIYVVEVPM